MGAEEELFKFFASLGVGGAIAGMIFFFYRKDIRGYTELWKTQSEVLTKVIVDNTKAITELNEKLRNNEYKAKEADTIRHPHSRSAVD